MQHISQLTTAPSGKSGEQTPNESGMLSDKQMGQLWERMAEMYGHRWTSSYGTDDRNGTWRKGLAGLTPQQIGTGLVACLKRRPRDGDEDWPPTLAEFRAMCLPPVIPRIHRDYIPLPKPQTDPDVVEKSIAKMKAALGAA